MPLHCLARTTTAAPDYLNALPPRPASMRHTRPQESLINLDCLIILLLQRILFLKAKEKLLLPWISSPSPGLPRHALDYLNALDILVMPWSTLQPRTAL